MEKEFSIKNFLKEYRILIIFILISPILCIFLLSLIVKWGTILINTNELIIDINSPIKIGEYLYYYISIVGIEVTGLLSYAILKSSIKSNKLSEDINNKEENRDKEKVRESALIIYYDLLSNIGILKMLYSTEILKSKIMQTNKLNIESDWVKNIANLRDILTGKELEMVFNLYNSFLLINELECRKPDTDKEVKRLVNELSENIFNPVLLDYLWMDFDGKSDLILNSKYFLVLRKIELASRTNFKNEEYIFYNEDKNLCVKQDNGKIKYKGQFINGILDTGIDEGYLDDGTLLYSFRYENGKIIKGKLNNKFREGYELVFDCEFNNKNKPENGYAVIFYSPSNIRYEGSCLNGKFNGEGKFYSKENLLNPTFSGIWKDDEKISGEFIDRSSKKIKYFKGEYRNNRPYSGKIKCSDEFKFDDSYGFEGIIQEGIILKGKGYKFFKSIIDEDYRDKNPWVDFQDEYLDNQYDDVHGDIPEDISEEMYQNQERFEKEMDLDRLKEKYGHIEELIKAEWVRGNCKLYDDDIINKIHLYYPNSEKKQKINQ